LLELKLAKIYKNICEKDIKSFIAFVNGFPTNDGKFNLSRLNSLFDDICKQYQYNSIVVEIIRAKDFDIKFNKVMQAIGRLCRCRNKNKDIYIYSDCELIERILYVCAESAPKLLNNEFRKLLDLKVQDSVIPEKVKQYSTQSKKAFTMIKKAAYTVRNSAQAVYEWQYLRDFVLKNPTTNNPGCYEDFYFKFDDEYSGYTYQQDSNYNITSLKMDTRAFGKQVSDVESDLPILMHFDVVKTLFERNKYAMKFNKAKYIMSPSLFQQVYLGALGEVVGKEIIETQSGWELKDISDVSLYELFDYQAGNFYFDFKHWDMFIRDNDAYVRKVERKLNRVKGKKAVIINLIKRNNALPKINIGETVIQIPYLLDPETGEINGTAIDFINENCS